MKQDVRELDMLIDEMLSYAKLGAHNLKLNREPVNAEHWLREIVQHYDTEKIVINLYCATHLPNEEKQIMIDKHLMSRAVHNLIRNGLRDAHKQLQISFTRESNQVSLIIEEDGEGIPKQFWEQVFQPFTRLDTSRDKQSGGYGLGLAITQKIVHQHGGKIQIEKSALGGVCFTINWTI